MKKLNSHRLAGTCQCGRKIDIEFLPGTTYECECGRKIELSFNQKENTYQVHWKSR